MCPSYHVVTSVIYILDDNNLKVALFASYGNERNVFEKVCPSVWSCVCVCVYVCDFKILLNLLKLLNVKYIHC